MALKLVPFLVLLCGVFAQALFAFFYLKAENVPPFWDYAMYANMALALWEQGSWSFFIDSFAQKYNLFFTLPSLLTFSVFGASRPTFILTNVVVYGLAYQAAASFLLRRLYGFSWTRAVLAALVLCSLIPFLWYPTLQGYPDMGAAALILFALVFSLCVSGREPKQALLIGVSLGLAIVFRRHYAYAGLAVLVAAALVDVRAWKTRSFWGHYAIRGAAALGVLALVEPHYLKEMLTVDYTSLYRSYERPALYVLSFIMAHGGALLWALALAGGALAWRRGLTARRPLLLVFLAPMVWLVFWLVGPAQAGQHYLIALLPVPLIAAGGAFFVSPRQGPRALSLGLGVVLVVNAAISLWFAPKGPLPSDPPSLGLLSAPRPPWTREDLPVLSALVQRLATTTTEQDTIVVSGSSFIFNQDLVRALYTDVLKNSAPAYRFLPAPESDGDQDPPLDVFAAANVFAVASPPQFHLDPERQKNVASLAAQFPPTSEASLLFTKDEETFALDSGVVVSLWRRRAWTPRALHAALAPLRANAVRAARSWVVTQSPARFGWASEATIQAVLTPQRPSLSLFFDKPLGAGAYRFDAQVRALSSCAGLVFSAQVKAPHGRVTRQQRTEILHFPGVISFPFDSEAGGGFLSVSFVGSGAPCLLEVKDLVVSE